MSEKTISFLKTLGLTPASFIASVAFAGAWYQTISPIPSEMRDLNANVQLLATKVEIHSVLIAQLSEVKAEISAMRKELSTMEVKLVQKHTP